MSKPGTPAVLVMAKAPRPGKVKTRLHPLLGPERCALLQAELIRHTVQLLAAQQVRTYLAYASTGPEDVTNIGGPPFDGVRLLTQRGADLGERLTAATAEAFADGAGPLLVIGTDAPALTSDHLSAAFAALEHTDLVLGPALDGGYYLIGMRSPHTRPFDLDPTLWGTDQVLAATRARAAEHGLNVHLLPALRDLDTPEDAAALLADRSRACCGEGPPLPRSIAALLRPEESV